MYSSHCLLSHLQNGTDVTFPAYLKDRRDKGDNASGKGSANKASCFEPARCPLSQQRPEESEGGGVAWVCIPAAGLCEGRHSHLQNRVITPELQCHCDWQGLRT